MCSPMSAKAMISSRFAAISAGASPSSVAARSMFARPVYSGWKPDPSSSSAPTRPLTATVPRVGLMTPATIFSSVDLPGAVLADHAERFAALQFERHVVERAKRRAPRAVRARGRQTSRSRPPRESTFA